MPIDTIHADIRDHEGLRRRAERVRAQGYRGMMAIHPDQLAIINAAFSPRAQEVANARAIVALFAANPGVGAIGHKSGMLDRPYLRRAETVVRLAGER